MSRPRRILKNIFAKRKSKSKATQKNKKKLAEIRSKRIRIKLATTKKTSNPIQFNYLVWWFFTFLVVWSKWSQWFLNFDNRVYIICILK